MKVFTKVATVLVVAIGTSIGAAALSAASATKAVHRARRSDRHALQLSQAMSFAEEVLAKAPVPAHSAAVGEGPKALRQPPQMPAVADLIDLHRYYRTSRPQRAVEAEVKTHLVQGRLDNSGTYGSPGVSVRYFVIALPTNGPNEYLAQLDYSLLEVGSVTFVRIDAQSVYTKDRQRGESIPPRSRASLTGYNKISLALASRGPINVRLDRVESARLAGVVNGLPPGEPPTCLEDDTLLKVSFSLPHGPPIQVSEVACEGTVLVQRAGREFRPLQDRSCLLLRLVANLVPRGADATRESARSCLPKS